MGLSCGIVGLPNSGKTTVFSVFTGKEVERSEFMFSTTGSVRGAADIPDDRLHRIAEFIPTEKIIPAQMTVVDIPGLVSGSSHGEGMGNSFLGDIKDSDALVHVIRCFERSGVQHATGTLDPAADAEIVDLELGQADLGTVQRNIERIGKKVRIGDKDARFSIEVFEKTKDHLEAGQPVRSMDLNDREQHALQPLFLMTAKPILFVANVGEDDATGTSERVASLREYARATGCGATHICGDIEAEIVQLDEDERGLFMEEFGLTESGRGRLIHAAFDLLGLQTFFTAGEKEVRAWVIHQGDTAPAGAGVIHSDFEKKFIRSETYGFEDLMELHTEAAIKQAGRMRLEGKSYVLQDGDVCHFLIGG